MSSPNCAASSPPSDFQTALARLLRDGALRDLFAHDRAAALHTLQVSKDDRPAIDALDAGELEAQATVLLRKRLDAIRPWLPATLRALGERAWPIFAAYARTFWPASSAEDARDFCYHLLQVTPAELHPRELHRADFATSSRKLSLHLLPTQRALQILFRRGHTTREWVIRLL